MRFPPAIIQLRRAQLILMLAVLVPTVLMTALGIVLLAVGSSSSMSVFLGVLVLAFTTTAVTGYILGSIFVGKGASLARVQNDFFSSVSHELRTPLTSIRLLLEGLATNRLGDAERVQVIALLSREVNRLDHLLVRTLDLSRMQSGRHAFHMRPLAITELVSESLASFDAATLTNPTRIEVHVDPDLVINGDRDTLTRAVLNLLVNAWKYTGDEKRIVLRARGVKRQVELVVEDNGPGIDPDERGVMFDGFTRGKAAAEKRAPGVGLGLTLVRTIVRAHRGKVELTSPPGHGASFRMILPRSRLPLHTAEAPTAAAPPSPDPIAPTAASAHPTPAGP